MNRPGFMERADFVARFGGVFEHSPWIAERAFDETLPADCDSAAGLHGALCGVFRIASHGERLVVLRAHPDLAGRLALAGNLTGDSTKEQASAGLDCLTLEELARFTELNDAYQRNFGFPFIMAVKGRSKDEILAAFQTRIENDAETEFEIACREVERIALLRLDGLLPERIDEQTS
jgi:urate oxidase